jgi:cryptochrome
MVTDHKSLTAVVQKNKGTKPSRTRSYDQAGLKEMKVSRAYLGPRKFSGGETEALAPLQRMLVRTKYISDFEKSKTSLNSIESSVFAVWLSQRSTLYVELKQIVKSQKHSLPPVSLKGQLIWREFYYCVVAVTADFEKIVGNNPICCQGRPTRDSWRLGKWSDRVSVHQARRLDSSSR